MHTRTSNARVVLLILVMAAALLHAVLPASAQAPGPERKIVVFQQQVVTGPAQERIVTDAGGWVIKPLPLVNGMAAVLPGAALAVLREHPLVERVDDDLTIVAISQVAARRAVAAGKSAPPPRPAQTIPWGISRIDAPSAWTYSTAAGVSLAVVDTGIDLDHKDLQANIAWGVNTINPVKSANDDNGHGTHVAGTAGAIKNTIGVVGAAPQVKLYAVKVLGRNGTGWLSDLIEGLTWCIDNGMQVVNMSLGSSSDNTSFHQAITAVYNAGILQVAAAGNNGDGYGTGTGEVTYPAAYPELIAVTATDSSDNFAVFSSFGSEVDLAAPGVEVYSTWNDGRYRTLSGASMAAPHVAGAAALRLALYPGESPDQIKAVLENSAQDLGAAGWDPYFGAGLVNALGAVLLP